MLAWGNRLWAGLRSPDQQAPGGNSDEQGDGATEHERPRRAEVVGHQAKDRRSDRDPSIA